VATRRLALRSLTRGFGLGGTIESGSLESVFERLRADDVGLTDDELTFLGVVLVVERTAPSAGGSGQGRVDRVVAAHYVRPLARDAAGHVQRLGPAVLATWEPRSGRFEHFAWGLIPELAVRVGRRAGDFELEQDRRREYLVVLAAGGVAGRDDVRAALDGFRLADTGTAAH